MLRERAIGTIGSRKRGYNGETCGEKESGAVSTGEGERGCGLLSRQQLDRHGPTACRLSYMASTM